MKKFKVGATSFRPSYGPNGVVVTKDTIVFVIDSLANLAYVVRHEQTSPDSDFKVNPYVTVCDHSTLTGLWGNHGTASMDKALCEARKLERNYAEKCYASDVKDVLAALRRIVAQYGERLTDKDRETIVRTIQKK